MEVISVQSDTYINSFIEEETASSNSNYKSITFIDFDLRKDNTPLYFQGITEENRFYDVMNQMSLAHICNIQKDFLIKAYHNKDILINYLKLYIDLLDKEITEDEFDQEINSNPDKYFVNIDRKVNIVEMEALSGLVKEIGGDLSIQDVSEIYSADFSEIIDYVKSSNLLPNG